MIPLSVLDLVPIREGSSLHDALAEAPAENDALPPANALAWALAEAPAKPSLRTLATLSAAKAG